MSLKELTKDIHLEAENMPWAKLLVSHKMTAEQYGLYLNNQVACYLALEDRADYFGILEEFPGLQRAMNIAHDRSFYDFSPKIFPSANEYIKYCSKMKYKQVLAHIYVRHFGDMYGGQMISKAIPSPQNIDWMGKNPDANTWSTMYDFQNKKELITAIRENLSDGMADEAKTCVQFAINLFKELEEYYDVSEVDIS